MDGRDHKLNLGGEQTIWYSKESKPHVSITGIPANSLDFLPMDFCVFGLSKIFENTVYTSRATTLSAHKLKNILYSPNHEERINRDPRIRNNLEEYIVHFQYASSKNLEVFEHISKLDIGRIVTCRVCGVVIG
ncbi:UNVERIFIED_CONTAM: hypothetical protein NCL1_29778 [Trichonephila clavipes]